MKQAEKECWLCKTTLNLHKHHIYFGVGNRKISDKNGFTAWLCEDHHRLMHSNRMHDLNLKMAQQEEYEKDHTREEFMKLIGRNYLWED